MLHRDIKPRNILLDDRSGHALVADFGLAKLMEGGYDVTTTGDVFGSPPYMSPEQTVDSGNVTAASDVYSLGATLYHLLTGRPPFMAAGTLETLRQVLYDDVVPPRQLNPAIDRDLETICLKCLEKDPRQRYATAAELEEELGRFLRGEPILARPLSAVGRFLRWTRRNPVVSALTATAAALLILVAVVATIGYFREAAERARADQNAAEKEENFTLARHSIETYLVQLTEDPRLRSHGLEPLRRELLETARQFYDAFDQRAADDLEFQAERARAYLRLAVITAELGDTTDAQYLYKQALGMVRKLSPQRPEDKELARLELTALNGLGSLDSATGRIGPAEARFREALGLAEKRLAAEPKDPAAAADVAECRLNLAGVLPDVAQSETQTRQAITIWEELHAQNPEEPQLAGDLARAYNNLAVLLRNAERPADAEAAYLRAEPLWQELVDRNPGIPEYRLELAKCLNNVGILHLNAPILEPKPRYARAESSLRRAIALREQLVKDHPDVPDYRSELAAGYVNLGTVFDETERSGEAVQT